MRYGNLAAVAVLRGPDWCRPEMIQYAAVLPRPAATACYDYVDLPGVEAQAMFWQIRFPSQVLDNCLYKRSPGAAHCQYTAVSALTASSVSNIIALCCAC